MYLALYRKYRPRTFAEVVSQQHITQTLTSQVKNKQFAHAYLFTGSRGTGKTSCAKILAKAINCLSPVEGNPCNKCEACKAIETGTSDVLEIDAASNNGVDDVRALRDEVMYSPVSCNYRVYIIDEVHMMSGAAFNALLKTIEEPPGHVVFILATTENHKVPATILSRCQQYQFRRITVEDSSKMLSDIAEKEKVYLEPEAADLISQISDGGMRDAINLLDQCISVNPNITAKIVRDTAGVAKREHLFKIADAVFENNSPAALNTLDYLHGQSKDIGLLLDELIIHYRNLMMLKAMKGDVSLVRALPEEYTMFENQNKKYSMAQIMRCLEILQGCAENLGKTKQRKTLAEMCFIKLCTPRLDSDTTSLSMRLDRLEQMIESGNIPMAVNNSSAENVQDKASDSEDNAISAKIKELTIKNKKAISLTPQPIAEPDTKPDTNVLDTENLNKVVLDTEERIVPQPQPNFEIEKNQDKEVVKEPVSKAETKSKALPQIQKKQSDICFPNEEIPIEVAVKRTSEAEKDQPEKEIVSNTGEISLPASENLSEPEDNTSETNTEYDLIPPPLEEPFPYENEETIPPADYAITNPAPLFEEEIPSLEQAANTNEKSSDISGQAIAGEPTANTGEQPLTGTKVRQWADIIERVPDFLTSLLTSTVAFYNGDTIDIEKGSVFLKSFMDRGDSTARLQQEIKAVLGKSYRINIVVQEEDSSANSESKIDQFLAMAKNMGVEIKEK